MNLYDLLPPEHMYIIFSLLFVLLTANLSINFSDQNFDYTQVKVYKISYKIFFCLMFICFSQMLVLIIYHVMTATSWWFERANLMLHATYLTLMFFALLLPHALTSARNKSRETSYSR